MRSILSTLAATLSLAALFSTQLTFAQVTASPSVINFQGRLVTPSGNPVPDGTYSIRFSLHDAFSAGTEKWNQTVAGVVVKNGTFAVPLSSFSSTLFDGNLWLELKIGTDAPLAPRTQIVSVPYAIKSNLALTVPDGSITNANLAGNITADKLANGTLNSLTWLLNGNTGTAGKFIGTNDNNPLVFRTNNIERIRILANGNIGIGMTPSNHRLELKSANNETLRLFGPGTSGSGGGITFGDDFGAYIREDTLDNLTVNAERTALIGGNIGLGTTTPKALLHVNGDYYGRGHLFLHAYEGDGNSGNAYIQARDDSTTSNIGMILRTKSGANLVNLLTASHDGRATFRGTIFSNVNFSVGSAGYEYALSVQTDAIANNWYQRSDARLKENIVQLSDPLSTVMGLRGVTYDWNKSANIGKQFNEGKQYGFLAQEVEKVLPTLVKNGDNGYKAVNYMGIIPVTVEAIKAQQSQIIALRQENDALKATLESVLKRLDAIEAQAAGNRK